MRYPCSDLFKQRIDRYYQLGSVINILPKFEEIKFFVVVFCCKNKVSNVFKAYKKHIDISLFYMISKYLIEQNLNTKSKFRNTFVTVDF